MSLQEILSGAEGSPVVEVEEPREFHWSASQVSTFRDCPRKWFFERVLRRSKPDSPAALFGQKVHKLREDWFREGKMPLGDSAEAKCARAGLDELPMPTEGVEFHVERFFRHRTPVRNVVGLIDLYFPEGADGESRPLVIDHKTTGDEAWVKSESDLASGDPQSAIYSQVAMDETGSRVVDLFWHYIIKKRRPTTVPVRLTVTRAESDDAYGACVSDAKKMLTIFTSGCKNSQSIEYNLDSCEAYGGCPFRGECKVDNQVKIERMRKMGEGALEALLSGFEKKKEALQEVVPPDAPAPDLSAAEPAPKKGRSGSKSSRPSKTKLKQRREFVEACVLAQLRGRVDESAQDVVDYALAVADALDEALG